MIGTHAAFHATTATVLLIIALALGNAVLLVFGLVLFGLLVLLRRAGTAAHVQASVAASRNQPLVGDLVTVTAKVQMGRGTGSALLHLPLSDGLELVRGSNVSWAAFARTPRPHEWRFVVRCRERGVHEVGMLHIHPQDHVPFRSAETMRVGAPLTITVRPKVRTQRRLRHVRARARTPLGTGDRARAGEAGTEFRELRDYAAGDPLHAVNWKATARRSHDELALTVNTFEPEGRKTVWLLLDGGAHMEVGDGDDNTMDAIIAGLLGIAEHYGGRGHRIGLTVFHQRATRVLYPESGGRQTQQVTRILSTLETHDGGDGLEAAVLKTRPFLARERPLVVLVTRPETDPTGTVAGVRALQTLSDQRKPLPILLVAPEPFVHARAQGIGPYAVRTATLAARHMHGVLRQQGVRVLDWDPGRAPLEGVLLREARA